MTKAAKDPKGVVKITGAISQTIRKRVLKEDGGQYTQMFISQVINNERGNDRIKMAHIKMDRIKEKRNKAIRKLIERMTIVDEIYLTALKEVPLN